MSLGESVSVGTAAKELGVSGATIRNWVEKGYIRQVPKDPVTGSADTWVLVPATEEQGQSAGVYDVRSGSDRTARDGSRYADW
jgi:general secretion pathway protein G